MTDETTAPGAAPAAASNEATETSATQTDAVPTTAISGDAPATPEAPRPKGVQKRIDELTANWRTTERDRDHWRELALKNAQPSPAPAAPQGKPTLEQFEYDQEKYADALVEWRLNEREKERESKQKEQETRAAAEKRTKTFVERESKYATDKDDYRPLSVIGMDPSWSFATQTMADAILEADEGPALLHYLDTHRDEASRIAQMSPTQTALALGRIVARLTAPEPVTTPQISSAPPPAPTIKPTAPVAKDPSSMSDTEFAAWRRKTIAAKRG